MVFIKDGNTLDNETVLSLSGQLRQLATLEFVNVYYQNLDRSDPVRLFGDEVEYLIVHLDDANRKARVLPIFPHVAKFLQDKRHLNPDHSTHNACPESSKDTEDIEFEKSYFTPECCSYMVESIPDEPYTLDSDYIPDVRKSLRTRRKRLEKILFLLGHKNSRVSTLSNFIQLGCEDFVYYGDEEFRKILFLDSDYVLSQFIPNICVTPISRFYEITNNIKIKRRGTKIYVKKYKAQKADDSTYDGCHACEDDKTLCDDSAAQSFEMSKTNKYLDDLRGFKLFPLLSQRQQELARRFLVPYDLDVGDELFQHIAEQVYLHDPLLQPQSSKAKVSKPSDSINAVNHENMIFMDTVGFGMGMCCLQVTFGCENLQEARYLYDQFVVLTPIFISLSSATVAFRGLLADIDNRWDVLVQAMDDLSSDRGLVKKGRYSTCSLFIDNSDFCVKNYRYLNDIDVGSDSDSFLHLIKMGIDPILARHIAHNFVYQPLVVYEEQLGDANCEETEMHYQIFHTTVWNSVRLNHPKHFAPGNTKGSKLPWRVEFRPMDIQLTDEENVMLISVVSYLVKVMLRERLNVYMPISLVDWNTEVSFRIESCHRELFYFREDVRSEKLGLKKFSVYDILYGQVGLFTIALEHLERERAENKISKQSYEDFKRYFNHYEQLALGNAPTNATRLRRYILTHPCYSGDGAISDRIQYDIVKNLTCF